jgi:Leucine-rich repeat (LRR) protein
MTFLFLFACKIDNSNNSIFNDVNLEMAVRATLKLDKSCEINTKDLDSVKEIICVDCKNLHGIKYLKNLKTITFANCSIDDFSEIKELQSIVSLKILNSKFTSIDFICDLISLEYLYLDNNKALINTAKLKKLSNIKELYLLNSQISDISSIEYLTNIETLWVYNNQIKDISMLEKLVNLENLNARNNNIKSISNFSKCKKLKTLDLAYNDIKFDKNFHSLKHVKELNLARNNIDRIDWIATIDSTIYVNLNLNPIKCNEVSKNKLVMNLIEKGILQLDCEN